MTTSTETNEEREREGGTMGSEDMLSERMTDRYKAKEAALDVQRTQEKLRIIERNRIIEAEREEDRLRLLAKRERAKKSQLQEQKEYAMRKQQQQADYKSYKLSSTYTEAQKNRKDRDAREKVARDALRAEKAKKQEEYSKKFKEEQAIARRKKKEKVKLQKEK